MTRPFSPQASGNKVSRQSVLCGSQNIVLNGKVGGGEGGGLRYSSPPPRYLVPPSSSAEPRGPCHHRSGTRAALLLADSRCGTAVPELDVRADRDVFIRGTTSFCLCLSLALRGGSLCAAHWHDGSTTGAVPGSCAFTLFSLFF